jgi:hypothetical protein
MKEKIHQADLLPSGCVIPYKMMTAAERNLKAFP